MSLVPDGVVDATARLIVTAIFFVWNLYEGSVLEAPYTDELVKLYKFPFWRLVLVFAVLAATYWCPRVGAMFALTVFFYFEDLEKLLQPWMTFATDK
jgi:hypothetical protein